MDPASPLAHALDTYREGLEAPARRLSRAWQIGCWAADESTGNTIGKPLCGDWTENSEEAPPALIALCWPTAPGLGRMDQVAVIL